MASPAGQAAHVPMTPALADRMTLDIATLAKKHRVHLVWVSSWRKAEAIAGSRAAAVPRINAPSDYLFALHELGHVISRDARRHNDRKGRYSAVLCEGAAWAWAAETANPALASRLSAKDWARIGYAFRTYLDPRFPTS